jgi:endonuclease-3
MSELERRLKIIKILQKSYPEAKIALKYSNPMELLVATVLSAQCTDVMVNKVTEKLFKKYTRVKDYAEAELAVFEQEIRSTGFYHNKAKNIIAAAKMILERFKGELPRTMEEMITLPGVARKTANIVLYNAFGVIAGIAVDTHVQRLSQRLGFTQNTDPGKIEQDLMSFVPKTQWGKFSYLLIDHGRAVCEAKRPKCPLCLVKELCPYFNKTKAED